MRRRALWLLVALPVFCLAAASAVWHIARAVNTAPTFYQQALDADSAALAAGGERFERQSLALASALNRCGPWEVQFTQEDINGWLGATLPLKFPEALPPEILQPRVAIGGGKFSVGARCRFQGGLRFISLTAEAYLAEQANVIAIRVEHARAGLLPLPLGHYQEQVCQVAARHGVAVRWSEAAGSPVALIRLPDDLPSRSNRRLILERLCIADRAIAIAGRVVEAPPIKREVAADESQPAVTAQSTASETRQR